MQFMKNHATKFFTEHRLATEMEKKKKKKAKKKKKKKANKQTEILMNKPVYLGLSILKLSKILMYGFWYGYV